VSEKRIYRQPPYQTLHSAEEVLGLLLSVDPYEGGTIEQLERKVALLEELLVKHMCRSITLDGLNELAGYDRFEEGCDE